MKQLSEILYSIFDVDNYNNQKNLESRNIFFVEFINLLAGGNVYREYRF